MTGKELYLRWTAQAGIFASWVTPVLFAQPFDYPDTAPITAVNPDWIRAAKDFALIIDLPGATSFEFVPALLEAGFAAVPIFNASPAPDVVVRPLQLVSSESTDKNPAVIEMRPIITALSGLSSAVSAVDARDPKRPAFLLDANRLRLTPTDEKDFDNRWMVFPQDFPSADFLKSQGISGVLLVQRSIQIPLDDLSHVLRRWQDAGLEIFALRTDDDDRWKPIDVPRPWRYKSLWYRALAILGLRRNAAGGFGDYIPDSSSAG